MESQPKLKPKTGRGIKIPPIKPIVQDVTEDVIDTKSDTPVAENSSPGLADAEVSSASAHEESNPGNAHVPAKNLDGYELILDQHNKACVTTISRWNRRTYRVGSPQLNKIIRRNAQNRGIDLRRTDVTEFNEMLRDQADSEAKVVEVYYRAAPIEGGVKIDLGDEEYTCVRITAGQVDIVSEGSNAYFHRTPLMRPLVMPSEAGNLKQLDKYVNVSDPEKILFTAWLTYTIANPKIATTNYVILVLNGGQGSGKSSLCKLILKLGDPSIIDVQILPTNIKDLAIAAQNAHILCYDNVRGFKQAMSDTLCIAATGGALAGRALYTDDGQHIIYLHVALVLNGIHGFINENDLAQRCLPLRLKVINEANRKSEAVMVRELQQDLPSIQRGLYDLIAGIFQHLPDAVVTNPERMIDFVQWLAAYEMVKGVPAGIYQATYSDNLRQAQMDALLENPLAAAMIGFAEELKHPWKGEPAKFLEELSYHVTTGIQRSNLWPKNAISMSQRLQTFQTALKAQGIFIEFGRSKNRWINVNTAKLDEEF